MGLCFASSGKVLNQKQTKKLVTVLSTIHDANELLTTKKDSHGNRIPKPEIVYEYTNNMSSVDLSDQYMAFHMSLRKKYEVVEETVFPYPQYDSPKCLHSQQEIRQQQTQS